METGLGFVFLKIAGLLGEWIGWLLLALAILTWKSRGRGRALAATLFVTTYLLAIPFGRNLLCEPLEAPFPPPDAAAIATFQPQAVVVLGGGVLNSPLQGAAIAPSALARLNVAWRMAHDLNLPLIASGGAIKTQRSEAEMMIEQAMNWGGIPKGIAESNSATTRSNATMVHGVLASLRVERVILVTSGIHLRRASRAFVQEGIEFLPVPADPRWFVANNWLTALRPLSGTLSDSADAIHEWVGHLAGR